MVHEAARMAHEGKDLADIIKRLEAMRDSIQVFWTMDTLGGGTAEENQTATWVGLLNSALVRRK